MFTTMLIWSHLQLHIKTVTLIFIVFPILGFFGMIFSQESPIYEKR